MSDDNNVMIYLNGKDKPSPLYTDMGRTDENL